MKQNFQYDLKSRNKNIFCFLDSSRDEPFTHLNKQNIERL